MKGSAAFAGAAAGRYGRRVVILATFLVLVLAPEESNLHFLLGQAYRHLGRQREAKEQFDLAAYLRSSSVVLRGTSSLNEAAGLLWDFLYGATA